MLAFHWKFSILSDYSYANGDISSDKSDAGVFSPTSDSPFQPEFTPLTDNQVFSNSDSNASISAKLDDAAGRPLADGQRGISSELPVSSVAGDSSVPMTGITYSSDNGKKPLNWYFSKQWRLRCNARI